MFPLLHILGAHAPRFAESNKMFYCRIFLINSEMSVSYFAYQPFKFSLLKIVNLYLLFIFLSYLLHFNFFVCCLLFLCNSFIFLLSSFSSLILNSSSQKESVMGRFDWFTGTQIFAAHAYKGNRINTLVIIIYIDYKYICNRNRIKRIYILYISIDTYNTSYRTNTKRQ